MFAAFLREIGASDLTARQEAITGRSQSHVDWTMVNRTTIGLTDAEWTTAYATLLDGSQRVAEWTDEMQDALGWREGRFQADPAQRAARTAKFNKLSTHGDSIVEETVQRLHHQLGNDAFSRLDAYVGQREGGKRSVERGPIRKGPVETAQSSTIPSQR
jgi:Arc/MetJ family transcription regulator